MNRIDRFLYPIERRNRCAQVGRLGWCTRREPPTESIAASRPSLRTAARRIRQLSPICPMQLSTCPQLGAHWKSPSMLLSLHAPPRCGGWCHGHHGKLWPSLRQGTGWHACHSSPCCQHPPAAVPRRKASRKLHGSGVPCAWAVNAPMLAVCVAPRKGMKCGARPGCPAAGGGKGGG